MSIIWAFDRIQNKHTLYHSLREHVTNTLNFEKRKMLSLTKEELKLHQDATNCYIC